MKSAPIVDETLARLFKDRPDPQEKVCSDQGLAIFLGIWSGISIRLKNGHLVQLECGHYKITRSLNRTGCPRCGAMIRAGYDYDKFRNIDHHDDFDWPADPLGNLNRPGN
jgi:hypothetical protein